MTKPPKKRPRPSKALDLPCDFDKRDSARFVPVSAGFELQLQNYTHQVFVVISKRNETRLRKWLQARHEARQ